MRKNTTIQNFLKDGKVNIYPKKQRKQELVLEYLVSKLDKEIIYSEKEVNDVMNGNTNCRDCAFFRRELVEHNYLIRTKDGRQYRIKRS